MAFINIIGLFIATDYFDFNTGFVFYLVKDLFGIAGITHSRCSGCNEMFYLVHFNQKLVRLDGFDKHLNLIFGDLSLFKNIKSQSKWNPNQGQFDKFGSALRSFNYIVNKKTGCIRTYING